MTIYIYFQDKNNWRDKYHPTTQLRMAKKIVEEGHKRDLYVSTISLILIDGIMRYGKKEEVSVKYFINGKEVSRREINEEYDEAFDTLDFLMMDEIFG